MNENNTADTVSKRERLYIGNLPFSVDGGYLKKFFQELLGEEAVLDAEVIVDKARGRSKGYGFVTFSSAEFAEKAVNFNGKEMESKDGSTRPISINPAHDKKANNDRGGFKPRRYNDNYRGDRGYYPNDRSNRGGNGNGSGNRRRGSYSNSGASASSNRDRNSSGNGRGYKSSYNERDYLYS